MNARQIASSSQYRHVKPSVTDAVVRFGQNHPRLLASLGFAAVLALAQSGVADAATAPNQASISSYGVISSTFTNFNTAPQTIIEGDVCFTTGPVSPPLTITGAVVTPCPPATGVDQGLALADLNAQACTFIGAGAIALDTLVVGVNSPGTIPPGCYFSGGAMNITVSTTVTLNGAGVYIFRPGGALNTGANSRVALAGGACASDVFWVPVGAATLGANAAPSPEPTFAGNILAAAGVTLGHFANLTGRALAFGGTVTTDANTITVPTCAPFGGGGGGGVVPPGILPARDVPTLSEWTIATLAALLAIAGLAAMRRRVR